MEIAGLSHRFGEHVAVDDLDLTVERGECFGLLGPERRRQDHDLAAAALAGIAAAAALLGRLAR